MKTLAMIVFTVYVVVIQLWSQSSAPMPTSNDASLRARGREIFATKCGKCHDADASKKLADGLADS